MLRNLILKIYNCSPRTVFQGFSRIFNMQAAAAFDRKRASELEKLLKKKMAKFTTANLVGIDPDKFKSHIRSAIGTTDCESEGYAKSELHRQRDLSIKFRWGHNHDFGDFYLDGQMQDRHITLMRNFCYLFPISLEAFEGKDVLDVGCWTGGTSLLLNAIGSRVVALEEARKYAEMTRFLAQSFGIDKDVTVIGKSLYQCNDKEYFDRFDIIYFPGVIYHLSDPLIALRILYNTCKVGGIILVESAGIDSPESVCLYEGSYVFHSGRKEDLNRGGWNWFLPSPLALSRMLKDAGFEEIQTVFHQKRVYGFAKKTAQAGITRAGLSVPDIK